MASFKESLASAEISTSNYSVSTLAEETEIDETWIRSDKYLWYDEYSDNNLSTIDELKNIFVNDKQINVTQETNAQYIPFRMPRYYDGVDLTSMNILIHYVTAGGYEDYSTPINVSYSSAKIQFAWLVPKNATVHSGDLSFEIHVTGSNSKGDEYLYKTRPNGKLNIIKSLEGNGVIEPDNSWITSFLKQVNEKVSEATTAANEAKAAAQDALEAAESVSSQVDNITLTVTNKIVTETLSGYYTKLEVDEIVSNIDYSDMLNEVQKKIDAIDGLANLAIEYNSSTNIMTFKNGEEVIASYVLNTNPTAEWTTSFRNSVKTDIDDAVKNVSDDLDSYKQTNDKAILDLQDDFDNLSSSTYTSEQIDEKLNEKANNSAISSMQQTIDQVKSTSDTNKSNISVVTNKLAEIEEKVNGINTDPSLSYYATYNAETGQYTLYEVNGDAESIKSQFTITGGGGGPTTSTTVKIDRVTLSPVTATKNDKVLIKYNFSSIDSSGEDTGEGTATWKVGNTVIATTIAIQGENTFDATDYVSVGTQKITLTVTDAAGTIAVKTWTVQVVDVRIETSFNDKFTYPIGTVSFDYTPYGSIEKTVHFILDDVEIDTVTTTSSGIPMSYTIPQQAHGSHLLDAYITAELNGSTIETNHVYKDIIWYDESSNVPVIGCVYKNITAKQYDSTNIIYTVYDPKTETPKVALAVDGETVSTLTLNTSTNTWQYKSSDVGDHVLTITCGDTVKTINVTIEKLDIDVEPITANLAFDFNPSGRSNNNDADRLWKYNDSIAMTVSDNFDWVNGGYQMDDNGDQYFCVKAGSSAVISYNLFADDARKNGKEFKIVFKSTNVRKSNATFLRCMANSIGLKMNVHEAYVSSSAANLYSPYSEEDIIEWEFNICKDSDIPLVMTYEDGTNFRPMIYTSDYSFTQTSPAEITIGSADCDVWIYRMKAYSSNLTYSGIIQNFIADGRSADEIIKRYNRNQIYDENNFLNPDVLAEKCPQLHILKVDCPHWTNDKKDFVKNTSAQCIYKNGDFALDNWKATNIYHSGRTKPCPLYMETYT